jgi:hypothetical protein
LSATISNTNLADVSITNVTGDITSPNRTLVISTKTNAFGSTAIKVIAVDNDNNRRTNTVALTINFINEAPTFDLSTNRVDVLKFGTVRTINNFVTNIVKGPTNASQVITFILTTSDSSFYSVPPTINTNGALSFAAGAKVGTNTVSVRLFNSGGTSFGGTNGSTAQTFVIVSPPNPYKLLAGTFNGLFYRTNGVFNDSAGFITLTMNTNGGFSGQLRLTNTYSFTGQFNASGTATFTVARTGMSSLSVSLTMDLSDNFTERATGTITDGTWTSVVTIDRATFSSTLNPCPYAGQYTIAFPGSTGSLPAGNGYGLVKIGAGGFATVSGSLADGTAISQSVSISKDGAWPFYASLYSGKGVVLGWITNSVETGLGGDVSWVKTGAAGGSYYRSGFTNDMTIDGSVYTAPATGARALNLLSGTIVASGGSLTGPFTNTFTLSTGNVVTLTSRANSMTNVVITSTNGFFTGSFTHPVTKLTSTFKGVILQNSTNAKGFFLSTNLSGSILIH